jgi:hypothetical protein
LVSDIKGGTQTEGVENRVLRRIFGPKKDEVTGDWRKLHNEEFHNLFPLPSIIRIMKSWKMKWARYAARKGWKKCMQDICGYPEEKEDQKVVK